MYGTPFLFSIVVESDTVSAENYIQSLFQKRPTTSHFESIKMNSFHPVESLTNATQMTFVLPHFMGPFSYLPESMLLKVDVKMSMLYNATTKEGPDIPPAKRVAPVNNLIHSLFKSCKIWLGETPITKNGENYGYKSYFIDTLSFDGPAKFSWLEGQLFYQDNFGSSLASQTAVGNGGFGSRMNRFKVPDQNSYHQGVVSLIGKVHSDLGSAQSGLISGLGIKVEFAFASDDFLIQVPTTDTDKYKITIQNATLYCPVAQLSPDTFRKIERKLQEEDVKMYLKRSEVTNKSIPTGTPIFTDRLFPGANLPSTLILAFLPTTNYIGTQHSNPFFLARQFGTLNSDQLEQNVEVHLPSGRRSSTGSFVSVQGTGDELDPTARTSDRAPPLLDRDGERLRADQNTCFIEQINLSLNGDSLDGFDGISANWREDMHDYIRLHYYMGFMESRTGNTLTYEEFMNGFYFMFFDLTTCHSKDDFSVPAVRQGNLHLQVKFSKGTPYNITMLIYAEYPTLLKIDKHRQIRMSY